MHTEQPIVTTRDPVTEDAVAKPKSGPHVPTRRQHALGIALVLAVACIWVIAAEFIQFIFNDESFNSPFFLTYYSVSLFSICLIGFFRSSWRRAFEPQTPYQPLTHLSSAEPIAPFQESPQSVPPARRALRLAFILAPIFFLSNWTFNVGLDNTSVASSSTIASLTAFFTLVFGALSGTEKFSLFKLIATGVVIGGVALISENDKHNGNSEDGLKGDLISVLSAAIYSVYTVILTHQSGGPESEMPLMMMLAFMGFYTAITAWPGFFIVHLTGLEPFKMPSWRSLAMLTANGLIGTVLSDFLWAKGVVLTTPLIATLSLSLSVPLSIIVDLTFRGERFEWVYLIGAACVFVGFIMVNTAEAFERQRKENEPITVSQDNEEQGIRLQETTV